MYWMNLHVSTLNIQFTADKMAGNSEKNVVVLYANKLKDYRKEKHHQTIPDCYPKKPYPTFYLHLHRHRGIPNSNP